LQVRRGKFGEFVGCSGYPECKYIRRDGDRLDARPTGDKCPECKEGDLLERKGRYGTFIACSRYPECKYRANPARGSRPKQEPKLLDEKCPLCGRPMVERTGRYGIFKSCSGYPECKGPQRSRPRGAAATPRV
jgi:DNA topoisomerase-1